jgi:peptide/nickel transport system permease protein
VTVLDVTAAGGTTTLVRPAGTRRWPRLVPLGIVVLVALVGPFVVPFDPTTVVGPSGQAPDSTYWFGTDSSGLDVFSRTVAATRLNLVIAVGVTVVATVLGILGGLIIGMNESRRGPVGLLARGLGRVVDLAEAVPAVLLGLIAVSFYGSSALTVAVVLAVVLAPLQIRLVRTEVLRVRGEAYLDACRMAGMSELTLTRRHVLPNSSWAALEAAPVVFAVSIIVTAALGFIGVGIPAPTAEWGSMLARGATDAIVGRWWSALFPVIALALCVTSVSLAAHALLRRTR